MFSSDVNKLLTNILVLLLQLLGGVSKLVIHTSATNVFQVMLVNNSHTAQYIKQLVQLISLVDNIDNATVYVNTSTNSAFNNTPNFNNSTEYVMFNASPWLLFIC